MISVKFMGRLGNCLIQYSAARIFASKFGLAIDLETNKSIMRMAGSAVNLYMGSGERKVPKETKIIRENEYLQLISSNSIESLHYIIEDSFQDPNFVSLYINEIKNTIRVPDQEKVPGSILVHMRLGDCDNSDRRLPYGYYRDALQRTSFKTGVITSDSPDHPDVKSLAREFELKISDLPPMQTLLSSRSYDKVILSEGTFSWWIGVLSDAEEVTINRRKRNSMWHGDIFIFPDWKQTLFCS